MRYVAASYYPRFGDPIGTFVTLVSDAEDPRGFAAAARAELAAESAAEWENGEQASYCSRPTEGGPCLDCEFCRVDIIAGQAFTYRARELFSAAELREHRQALRRGEVICLPRA